MRQLLLAALGAAGSLLMGLPALAQLSNTTSTFSGQVAAICLFNLPGNIALTYDSNQNRIAALKKGFLLDTNISPVRIQASRLVVVSEPPPYASAITPYLYIYDSANPVFVTASKSYEDQGQAFIVSTTNSNTFF